MLPSSVGMLPPRSFSESESDVTPVRRPSSVGTLPLTPDGVCEPPALFRSSAPLSCVSCPSWVGIGPLRLL